MSDLDAGLSSTANIPQHDTQPASIDATLDAAFETPAEGSEPSDPSASNEPAQDASAATTEQPPAIVDPKVQTTGDKGPIPYDRHEAALANARAKARDEALAEHRDHLEIVAELKRDFPGTLARLLEEGAGDPRFSESITAKAAALLNARKQTAKANEEPQPDAVMRYEDGTSEPTYSPAQMRKWNEWRERQFEKRIGEQFKPLQELQQQVLKSREQQELAKTALTVAEKKGAQWKAMPFFEDHKAAILERQQAIYTEMQQAGNLDPAQAPWDALQQAYREVVSTNAIPKLQSRQADSLVADAARKRAASSSDPAAMAPAQPRKPRTVDEALDQGFGIAV